MGAVDLGCGRRWYMGIPSGLSWQRDAAIFLTTEIKLGEGQDYQIGCSA